MASNILFFSCMIRRKNYERLSGCEDTSKERVWDLVFICKAYMRQHFGNKILENFHF